MHRTHILPDVRPFFPKTAMKTASKKSFLITSPVQLFSPRYNPDSSTAYVHDGISGLCEGTVDFLCCFKKFISTEQQQRSIYRLRTTVSPHYSAVEKDNGKQMPEDTTLHIQKQDIFGVLSLLQWHQGRCICMFMKLGLPIASPLCVFMSK